MARSIVSKPNTVAPDSDYPGGRFKDKVGSNPGTRVNEAMTGDWSQFFDKMMRETGATYNELPDNEYSGQQFFDALLNLFGGLRRTVVEIGAWNMDADSNKVVSTDVPYEKVRGYNFVILADSSLGDFMYPTTSVVGLSGFEYGVAGVATSSSGDFQVTLSRAASGFFDSTNFNDPLQNRGYIIIEYTP